MDKTQSFILQIRRITASENTNICSAINRIPAVSNCPYKPLFTNSQNCDQYGAADAIFTTDKTWGKKSPVSYDFDALSMVISFSIIQRISQIHPGVHKRKKTAELFLRRPSFNSYP